MKMKGIVMHRNAMAACDRHLAKGTRQVLGADSTKEVRVSKVSNDPAYVCYCGVAATFYLLEVKSEKREPGQPRITRGAAEGASHASPPKAIPFPRQKNEW